MTRDVVAKVARLLAIVRRGRMRRDAAQPGFLNKPEDPRHAARRARFRRVFASEDGRLVLAEILEIGGALRPHDPQIDGDLETFEGARRLALAILDLSEPDA